MHLGQTESGEKRKEMRLRGDWELAPVCHDQAEPLALRGAKPFQGPEHMNSGAE